MSKTHILFVVDHFHPYTGGLQQFVLQLARRCNTPDFRASVLTFNYDPKHLADEETIEGIHVYRLPSTAILGKAYTLPHLFSSKYHAMLHALEVRNIDIVVTNTRFFLSSVIGMRFARHIGAEHIHVEHGNRFVVHPNPLVTLCAWLFDQTFGRMVMGGADHVIAISKAGVPFCKRLGAREVSVVHNATDVSLFRSLDKAVSTASSDAVWRSSTRACSVACASSKVPAMPTSWPASHPHRGPARSTRPFGVRASRAVGWRYARSTLSARSTSRIPAST